MKKKQTKIKNKKKLMAMQSIVKRRSILVYITILYLIHASIYEY